MALENFELDLKTHPNRFNGLYDAAIAAEKAGNKEKAILYFKKLVEISDPKNCKRPELDHARSFLSAIYVTCHLQLSFRTIFQTTNKCIPSIKFFRQDIYAYYY